MKLNVKAFAIACGLTMGLGLLAATWFAVLVQGAAEAAAYDGILTRVLWGYEVTPLGGVFGLGWGLLNGIIGGAVFAGAYNLVSDRLGPRAS